MKIFGSFNQAGLMYNATIQDKNVALLNLTQSLATYKLTKKYNAKLKAIGSFIGLLAITEPKTYDRKTKEGMRHRHEIRNELHLLDDDTFLRRLSELLHNEG